MSVRMAEVTESVCMMSAAYRGGPPLSTHILCLLGIWPAGRHRLSFAEDAMYTGCAEARVSSRFDANAHGSCSSCNDCGAAPMYAPRLASREPDPRNTVRVSWPR